MLKIEIDCDFMGEDGLFYATAFRLYVSYFIYELPTDIVYHLEKHGADLNLPLYLKLIEKDTPRLKLLSVETCSLR